jgi:hypothetical protein
METTIQQLTENARLAYRNADSSGKKLLSDLFGSDTLVPQKITDRIKSWEDVCNFLSLDPKRCLPFDTELPYSSKDEISGNAYFKLCKIIEVLNEGWEPNWDNSNEPKYYPWFYMDSKADSGFGLSYDDCAYDYSRTTVGSRLCFKSSELAIYAAKQFRSEYKDYMKP